LLNSRTRLSCTQGQFLQKGIRYGHYATIDAIATILIRLTMVVKMSYGQRHSVEIPLMHHSNLLAENDPDTGGARRANSI
jgi:hypothetical protein